MRCYTRRVSGWPSGLRRQTQEMIFPVNSRCWVFWSPNEGVGSNPTSDNSFFITEYKLFELLNLDLTRTYRFQ